MCHGENYLTTFSLLKGFKIIFSRHLDKLIIYNLVIKRNKHKLLSEKLISQTFKISALKLFSYS